MRSFWRGALGVIILFAFFAPTITYSKLPYHGQDVNDGKAVDYGVGFSLGLDHSTASIYFSDGTVVDVATVPGSATYKAMMRPHEFVYEDWRSLDSQDTNSTTPPIRPIQTHSLTTSLRHRLPSWLGGSNTYSPLSLSISPMLQALKASTEAYLETPLSAAEVVFSIPVTDAHFDAIDSASSFLSLDLSLYRRPAGVFAALTHGIGGEARICNELVLIVEYSDTALTALLEKNCGYLENMRLVHDTRLGATNTQSMHSNIANHREDLVRILRNITRELEEAPWRRQFREICDTYAQDPCPLDDMPDEEPKYISELVIFGEHVDDRVLHESLKEALGETLYESSIAAASTSLRENMHLNSVPEPRFAAARGAAYTNWINLNTEPLSDWELKYLYNR